MLSHFSRVRLCATLWTAAFRAPPSMGFSRQEYWSGVPLPSPSVYLVLCNFYHICRFGQPPPLSGYRIFTSQASPELPFYSQNHYTSPSFLNSWKTLGFSPSLLFVISSMLCKWNHTVHKTMWLTFKISVIPLRSTRLLCLCSFFFIAE